TTTLDSDDDNWDGFGQESVPSKFDEDPETKERRRRERLESRKHDPFYIPPADDLEIDAIPIVKLDVGEISAELKAKGKISSKGKKSKKVKGSVSLIDLPEARNTTAYEINRDGEMPDNAVADTTHGVDKKSNQFLDADTLAIMSVDLTQSSTNLGDSTLHFNVERARTLSAPVPKPGDFNVTVLRKKIDDDGKKKKKKSKDAAGGAVEEDGEKKKKKKKTPVATDGEVVVTKKKKKSVVTVDSPLPVSVVDQVRPVTPVLAEAPKAESAFAALDAVKISQLATHKVIYGDDNIGIGLDWIVHGPMVNSILSTSVSLTIHNYSQHPLENVKIALNDHPIIRILPVGGASVLKAESESIAVDGVTKVDSVMLIACDEPVLKTLRLEGNVTFDLNGTPTQAAFDVILPSTLNLLPTSLTPVDGTSFAALLSDSSHFPFSASTQFTIPSIEDFTAVIEKLAPRLRLAVVEVIPGTAASVYARSLRGAHMAGLVKVRPKAAAPGRGKPSGPAGKSNAGLVSVEFKCGDRGILDALIEEVNELAGEF
ncbi:hypothetical protein HDU76_002051, partial [Blyttiomyces sp. JEL0837]